MSKGAGERATGGSIKLVGLTKVYGSETVVDRFEAEVGDGEFFSMLGPSGSGKTTTLMMVAGFAGIDAGQLVVDGRDLSSVPPERRGFGMVFQNYAIFPHLNVFENVAFPLRARGTKRADVQERVTWALDLVRLGGFADRYARQLSGGQQQRVAIARAIVFHPRIVLMDEPLGALDKNLRYEMQVEIKEIQQRLGMTVLYVTHDQEEAMNLSDRMAIMSRGRVEQIGTPSAVYERPANAFVARFLGEANLLPGVVRERQATETLFQPAGSEPLLRSAGQCVPGSGERGQLFVRPERLRVSPGADYLTPCDNILRGRVRRTSFLGNVVRYAVDIEGGLALTADATNLSTGFRPAVGEAVTVGWLAADSSILRADAA